MDSEHEEIKKWLDGREIHEIDYRDFPDRLMDPFAGAHKRRVIYVGCTPGRKAKNCLSEVIARISPIVSKDRLRITTDTIYPVLSFNMGKAIDGDFEAAAILISEYGSDGLHPGMRLPFVFASPNVLTAEEANTRLHNCNNMICLGARYLSPRKAADISRAWLEYDFDPYRNGDRVQRYLKCVKFGLDARAFADKALQEEPAGGGRKIVLCADHRGVGPKDQFLQKLEGEGYNVVDVGTYSDTRCDYSQFAAGAAYELMSGSPKGSVIIGFCGSGIGIASAAKMWGVYGARCTTEQAAEDARKALDANLLTLPADDTSPEGLGLAGRIIGRFLSTEFEPGQAGCYRDRMLQNEREALQYVRSNYP